MRHTLAKNTKYTLKAKQEKQIRQNKKEHQNRNRGLQGERNGTNKHQPSNKKI